MAPSAANQMQEALTALWRFVVLYLVRPVALICGALISSFYRVVSGGLIVLTATA
jgi:hypothetical protein